MQTSLNRLVGQTILIIALFFCVERFCHEKTDGFSMRKIRATLPYNSEFAIGPLSMHKQEELSTILSQPFTYLTSGGECYVFASEDGQYVLKFFKHHHMRLHSFLDPLLPQLYINHRAQKLNTLFTSCMLAWTRFKKETGLVYLHLNPSDNLHLNLTLYDKIKVRHSLDLDQFTFALQKRASLAYPTLTALKEAQEIEAVKARLTSWVDLIARRCQVGLSEHDARKRNFGFIKDQAIELDLGSFKLDESLQSAENCKKAVLVETRKLRSWIHKYHPELLDFVEQVIKLKTEE